MKSRSTANRSVLGSLSASLLLGAFALACGQGGSGLSSGDWASWRGPSGDGISTAANLPTTWEPDGPEVEWKAAIPGSGNSSPIVVGDRVYLTSAVGQGEGLDRRVVALNLADGSIVWETSIAKRSPEQKHYLNTAAGATPVSDGRFIYAYFGRELAKLDGDGTIVWNREIDPNYEEFSRYGAASSPVLVDDLVVILQDREWGNVEEEGWLAAFDQKTGDEVWRTSWMNTCCSYVTPFVMDRGAGSEIFIVHAGKLVSYDARTGDVLWEDAQVINQPVAGPVTDGDLLCVGSGAHNVRSTSCRRLTGAGANTQVEILWGTIRGVPETASPLLYQGNLFLLTQKGILAAYDPLTGDMRWRQRLPGAGYHASLVAGEGKIYVVGRGGTVTVIEAAGEYRLLAENQLGETAAVASPALIDGRILVRTESGLVCIGNGDASA